MYIYIYIYISIHTNTTTNNNNNNDNNKLLSCPLKGLQDDAPVTPQLVRGADHGAANLAGQLII